MRQTKTLGILGGGQLGQMMLPTLINLDIPVYFMDPDPNCSVSSWCPRFEVGDFRDYETVLAFGRKVDVITIEIEQVNADALAQLEQEGKEVYPSPAALKIIQDKGLQKQFYQEHGLPSADFHLFDHAQAVREALASGHISIPFVQKMRQFGYDGKGVQIIRSEADLHKLFDVPCVVEDLVDIEKELSVIVAADAFGRVVPFPLVDMMFHPEANLVELLQCPAMIEPHLEREAMLLAEDCLKAFNTRGLLAVELFLDKKGRLFINEVAPRAHNSGHHTIESCTTSQFEQHIRSVMGYPLGDTRLHSPAVMVNILGEPGFEGPVVYEGLDAAQALPGVHIHLYGKAITKPFRKMGHATITAETPDEAIEIARKTQKEIRVRS